MMIVSGELYLSQTVTNCPELLDKSSLNVCVQYHWSTTSCWRNPPAGQTKPGAREGLEEGAADKEGLEEGATEGDTDGTNDREGLEEGTTEGDTEGAIGDLVGVFPFFLDFSPFFLLGSSPPPFFFLVSFFSLELSLVFSLDLPLFFYPFYLLFYLSSLNWDGLLARFVS